MLENEFLSGVIEGFYGAPWSQSERMMVFDWMSDWGLNTYLYAPKDDMKQRLLWRERYSFPESEELKEVTQACKSRGIRLIYALSPGLDIRYSEASELDHLKSRFDHMIQLGFENFALLFDDIPDVMRPEDQERWSSFAAAQCDVTNQLFQWVRDQLPAARFLFCPTPYCGRMRDRGLGGEGYLETIGKELNSEIDVFWTGPEIISEEITLDNIQEITKALGRKPLIWDNLHANDYDGRRFYCGPYSGRPLELRNEVSGILLNPNNEAPLNYVPVRTMAEYLRYDTSEWDPRQAYIDAMSSWALQFESAGKPIELDELILFGDCFYLPYEEGPEAEDLFNAIKDLFSSSSTEEWKKRFEPFKRQATTLKSTCGEIVNLWNRALFAALSRRAWDLREEMDLILTCANLKNQDPAPELRSDFHLPRTYRGGMAQRLQGLLQQNEDGTFHFKK